MRQKTGQLEPGLDAFCARPHVLATPEGGDFGVIDEKLRALGRKRRISVRTQNIFSAVRLVANSPMIAVAPESVAREIAQARDLAMGPPPIELPNAFISLTWSAANDSDLGSAWFREGFIRAFDETKSQRALS